MKPGAAITDRLSPLLASQWAAWVIVLGLALLLRLPGLVDRSLWYDEAFAVLFSAKGLPAMVEGTLRAQSGIAADVHPLLYYTLLGIWGKAFGTSVAAVRGLSLGLGLGVVALGFVLGRRSLGPRAGLIGGILLAVSPFQIHYAQEVRMYALLAGLLLGATWAYWEARSGAGLGAWAAFAALSAAAQYTHNLAAFYLIALAVLPWMERRWRLAARTLGAGLLAAALYLPWLLYL
ncbi:MAG: glycosyltransferase family 39 protein, partial [Anaerolineales bacterium]